MSEVEQEQPTHNAFDRPLDLSEVKSTDKDDKKKSKKEKKKEK